jgi:hypothetical protein
LPWITGKLGDISLPLPNQIRNWIEELDDPEFDKREQASRKLTEAGSAVEFLLRKALAEKRSLEFRRRAAAILKNLEANPIRPGDLRIRRCLQVLESIGTAETVSPIEDLQRRGVAEASHALQRLKKRGISSN